MLRVSCSILSQAAESAVAATAVTATVSHTKRASLKPLLNRKSSVCNSIMTVAAAEADMACTPSSTAAAADDASSTSPGPPYTTPEALDAHVERSWAYFRSLGSPKWHVAPMVDQVQNSSLQHSSTPNHQ